MTEEQRTYIDVTMEELREVTGALPTWKVPGPDGFTAEFFKSFAAEVALALMEMYKEALEEGILPPTLRQALLSLVPKEGKDPSDCKYYHYQLPNFLMQFDAKIISKILANQLNRVTSITSTINSDQGVFICGHVERYMNFYYMQMIYYCLCQSRPDRNPVS